MTVPATALVPAPGLAAGTTACWPSVVAPALGPVPAARRTGGPASVVSGGPPRPAVRGTAGAGLPLVTAPGARTGVPLVAPAAASGGALAGGTATVGAAATTRAAGIMGGGHGGTFETTGAEALRRNSRSGPSCAHRAPAIQHSGRAKPGRDRRRGRRPAATGRPRRAGTRPPGHPACGTDEHDPVSRGALGSRAPSSRHHRHDPGGPGRSTIRPVKPARAGPGVRRRRQPAPRAVR